MTKDEQIKTLKEQRAVLRASNEKFRKGFIDKACEWLDNTLPNIEYITNASALRQTKRQYIESFCKAMTETERQVTIDGKQYRVKRLKPDYCHCEKCVFMRSCGINQIETPPCKVHNLDESEYFEAE